MPKKQKHTHSLGSLRKHISYFKINLFIKYMLKICLFKYFNKLAMWVRSSGRD